MRKIFLMSLSLTLLFAVGSSNCMDKENVVVPVKGENKSEAVSSIHKKLMEIKMAYDSVNKTEEKVFKKVRSLQIKKNLVRGVQVLFGAGAVFRFGNLTCFGSRIGDSLIGDHDLFRSCQWRNMFHAPEYFLQTLLCIGAFIATGVVAHIIEKRRQIEEQQAVKSEELKEILTMCNVKVQDLLSENPEKFTKEDQEDLRSLYSKNKQLKKSDHIKKMTYYPVRFGHVMQHVLGGKKEIAKDVL